MTMIKASEYVLSDSIDVNFGSTSEYNEWIGVGAGESDIALGSTGWTATVDGTGNGNAGYWPGPYPDTVCDTYIYHSSILNLSIEGLDDAAIYQFDILLCRESITERLNEVTVAGGTPQIIDVDDNTTLLYFTNVSPTSGAIAITSEINSEASYCYFNAMVIREYTQ